MSLQGCTSAAGNVSVQLASEKTVSERTQDKQSAARPQRLPFNLQTSQHQDNPSEAAGVSQASCRLLEQGAAYQEGASIAVLQHEPGFLGGLWAGVAAGVFIGLLAPQGVEGVRAPNVCVLQHRQRGVLQHMAGIITLSRPTPNSAHTTTEACNYAPQVCVL